MFGKVVAAGLAAASSIVLLAGQAAAVTASSLVPAVLLPGPGQPVAATCAAEPVAVGVGSTGGLTYLLIGTAVATGTDPVELECKLFDTDANVDLIAARSGSRAGPLSVLESEVVVHTLDNFIVCVKADWIDADGTEHSTPWTAADGTPCG